MADLDAQDRLLKASSRSILALTGSSGRTLTEASCSDELDQNHQQTIDDSHSEQGTYKPQAKAVSEPPQAQPQTTQSLLPASVPGAFSQGGRIHRLEEVTEESAPFPCLPKAHAVQASLVKHEEDSKQALEDLQHQMAAQMAEMRRMSQELQTFRQSADAPKKIKQPRQVKSFTRSLKSNMKSVASLFKKRKDKSSAQELQDPDASCKKEDNCCDNASIAKAIPVHCERVELVEESGPDHQETLLNRIGGPKVLQSMVQLFYTMAVADESLMEFFQGVDLDVLSLHQQRFLSMAFTKIPQGINVESMVINRHQRLFAKGLNAKHFDIVAQHLVSAMQAHDLNDDLINEVIGIVAPFRKAFEQGAKEAQNNAV